MISPSQASVLIVDDSATMRTVLRGMLQRIKFRVIDEAENGEEALARVRVANYALIISDWHMGPIDGLQLLQQIKRTSRAGVNRFIFMTTDAGWGSQVSAKMEGADAFLAKPFKFEALQAKIETVLGR